MVNMQAALLRPFLNHQFLIVLAETRDFRKIDKLVMQNQVDIDIEIRKAQEANNQDVEASLKMYKQIARLVDTAHAGNIIVVRELIAAGVDKTEALQLAVERDDVPGAKILIAEDAFRPDMASDYPYLLRLIKANKIIWKALLAHRSDEIKDLWLLFEFSLLSIASRPNDVEQEDVNPEAMNYHQNFIAGMDILSNLPSEIQMNILSYLTPHWMTEYRKDRQVLHLFKAVAEQKGIKRRHEFLSTPPEDRPSIKLASGRSQPSIFG